MKVLVDKRDEKIVKETVAQLNKKHKSNLVVEIPGIKTTGGFILTDIDERIRINHTLDYILEVSREKIKSKISESLFN